MARIKKAARAKPNFHPEPETQKEEEKDEEEEEKEEEKEGEEKKKSIQEKEEEEEEADEEVEVVEAEEEEEEEEADKEAEVVEAEEEEEEEEADEEVEVVKVEEEEEETDKEAKVVETEEEEEEEEANEEAEVVEAEEEEEEEEEVEEAMTEKEEEDAEEEEGEVEVEVEEEEEGDAGSTSPLEQDQKSEKRSKDNVDGFRAQLAELGLRIVRIRGDGNCLFRALSDQLCGDQESYAECRQMVVEYLVGHPEEFAGFFSEGDAGSFEEYCTKMSQDAAWGGNLELQAASKTFHINIRVYWLDQERLAVSEINNFNDKDTLSLSYHNGTHYNSLHKIKDCDSSEVKERAAYKRKGKMKDSGELDDDLLESIMFATGSTGANLIRSVLQLEDGDTTAAVNMVLKELTSTMDAAENDEGEIEDLPCLNNDPQRKLKKRKILPCLNNDPQRKLKKRKIYPDGNEEEKDSNSSKEDPD